MRHLIVLAFASCLVAPPSSAQAADEAARTHCQAIARVIYGDIRGQQVMIDSLKAQTPKTPAEEARLTRLETALAEDSKLFESLRQLYASAAKPTPEAINELRNTPFNEIKRQAAVCLAG